MKFKMALGFALLFAVASAATFLFVHFALTSSMRQHLDEGLVSAADEMRDVYESKKTLPRDELFKAMEAEFNEEAQSEGVNDIYYLLLSQKGEILAKSPIDSWHDLAEDAHERALKTKRPMFKTVGVRHHKAKVRTLDERFPDGLVIEIGKSMNSEEGVARVFAQKSLIIFSFLIVFGALAGWFMAWRSMAGVERLKVAAKALGQGDFSARAVSAREDSEIEELRSTFNEMAGKIQALVRELRMVTDDIAHDMRTPLTRIKGLLDLSIQGDAAQWKETAGDISEECDALIQMINTMLEITKTETGLANLSFKPLDIVEIVSEARRLFLPMAEAQKTKIVLERDEERLMVNGDRLKLQRAIANLVDNAIKYSSDGGIVKLSIHRDANCARLGVADNGDGISEADQKRIFDRFFRCDASRSKPGSGLGLSLVKAIVAAHNGEINVSSELGKGSTFTVDIPLA